MNADHQGIKESTRQSAGPLSAAGRDPSMKETPGPPPACRGAALSAELQPRPRGTRPRPRPSRASRGHTQAPPLPQPRTPEPRRAEGAVTLGCQRLTAEDSLPCPWPTGHHQSVQGWVSTEVCRPHQGTLLCHCVRASKRRVWTQLDLASPFVHTDAPTPLLCPHPPCDLSPTPI